MRVLTFMSLGETKSEVKYDDLCKELDIGVDEIEEFVIEGTKHNYIVRCVLESFDIPTNYSVVDCFWEKGALR